MRFFTFVNSCVGNLGISGLWRGLSCLVYHFANAVNKCFGYDMSRFMKTYAFSSRREVTVVKVTICCNLEISATDRAICQYKCKAMPSKLILTLPKAFLALLLQNRPGIIAEALVRTQIVLGIPWVDGRMAAITMGAQRIQRANMAEAKVILVTADERKWGGWKGFSIHLDRMMKLGSYEGGRAAMPAGMHRLVPARIPCASLLRLGGHQATVQRSPILDETVLGTFLPAIHVHKRGVIDMLMLGHTLEFTRKNPRQM